MAAFSSFALVQGENHVLQTCNSFFYSNIFTFLNFTLYMLWYFVFWTSFQSFSLIVNILLLILDVFLYFIWLYFMLLWVPLAFFDFFCWLHLPTCQKQQYFFFTGIHSTQGRIATTSYGVTRKRRWKDEKHIEKMFRKNPKISINFRLKTIKICSVS